MSSIFILGLLSVTSALYIKSIDTDVVILNTGRNANQAVSECGANLTLTCQFKKNTFAVVWKHANVFSFIAMCIHNYCDINPEYVGQYDISLDKAMCIVNLTVINVKMKDNGRRLVCSTGTHSDSQIVTVRDYHLDLSQERKTGTIKAASGCVSQDTDVSFKWMKIDACNSIETQFAPKVRFTNTSSCSNDSVCGNYQQIQYIEEVVYTHIEHGKHHLKVIAIYGNESKNADEHVVKYRILKGEKHSCHLHDTLSSYNIIFIAAGIGFGIIIIFSMALFRKVRYKFQEFFIVTRIHMDQRETGYMIAHNHNTVKFEKTGR